MKYWLVNGVALFEIWTAVILWHLLKCICSSQPVVFAAGRFPKVCWIFTLGLINHCCVCHTWNFYCKLFHSVKYQEDLLCKAIEPKCCNVETSAASVSGTVSTVQFNKVMQNLLKKKKKKKRGKIIGFETQAAHVNSLLTYAIHANAIYYYLDTFFENMILFRLSFVHCPALQGYLYYMLYPPLCFSVCVCMRMCVDWISACTGPREVLYVSQVWSSPNQSESTK